MSRLFWKFFLFIWCAQIFGTMSIELILNLKRGAERPDANVPQRPNILIESAAATLQYGGPAALQQLIESSLYKQVIAVDQRNHELLGRPIEERTLLIAKNQALQGGPPDMARQIKLADGRTYLLFLDPMASPPAGADRSSDKPHKYRFLPPESLVTHMIVSMIVAAFLARYVLNPIRRLHFGLQTAATGNLQPGAVTDMSGRNDELADLLKEFNQTSSQLQALINGQRRLLHDVSHEVRSPLARIQMAIGLARQQPEKGLDMLDRIERESIRIDRMIEELLTLSRLENREPGLINEEVCIDEILTEVVDSARFEAEANRKTVHLSANKGIMVKGKPELLQSAVENVVRNALKHTDPGKGVVIEAGMDCGTNMTRIAVLDSGSGVPAAELDAIFEPFYRGSTEANFVGYGLGLAIARRIIQVHGGTIRALNLAQGGLCVEIFIPATYHKESSATTA